MISFTSFIAHINFPLEGTSSNPKIGFSDPLNCSSIHVKFQRTPGWHGLTGRRGTSDCVVTRWPHPHPQPQSTSNWRPLMLAGHDDDVSPRCQAPCPLARPRWVPTVAECTWNWLATSVASHGCDISGRLIKSESSRRALIKFLGSS